MTTWLHILLLSFAKATPLFLACSGGLLSELSGVINFALEGMMLMGAFGAVWATFVSGSPWVGLLGGAAGGVLIGILHGIVTLKFRANQIVSSIALNLFAAGLTGLLLNQVFEVYGTSPTVEKLPGVFSVLTKISGESTSPRLELLTGGLSIVTPVFLAVCLMVVFFIDRTTWGLRVRACGENPSAARASGLSVFRLRFFAVLAGGALAGLGGAYLSIGELAQFVENLTQGRGYLAVAAVILGRWRPAGVLLTALFFGFTEALSEWMAVHWPSIPIQAFLAFPYAVCFLVLMLRWGRRHPPSALGEL